MSAEPEKPLEDPQEDGDDCVDDGEEEWGDEEEEYELPEGTPEELSDQGSALIREGNLEKAIEMFNAALEKKVDEVGDEDPELAGFYLSYGDALLQKEEAQADVFAHGDENDGDDFEAAWESLELARICFEKRLSLAEEEDPPSVDTEAGKLLIFVRLRMGDHHQLCDDHEGACTEYELAIPLVEKYAPTDERYAEVLCPIAISLQTQGKPDKAVGYYERTLGHLKSHLSALDASGGDEALKEKFEELRKDVEEKITQCKIDIESAKDAPTAEAAAAAAAAPKTNGSFDKAQRPGEPVTVVAVKRKAKDAPEDSAAKRPAAEAGA